MRTPDWQSEDGAIQLHCCDCMELLPTIPAGTVDAVVTDPPYGLGDTAARARPSNYQRASGMAARTWDTEAANVKPFLSIAPVIVIWGGNYFALPPSRCWLTWFKPDAPPSMSNVELAWTNLNRNSRHISHSIAATNGERAGHPTQKPSMVMVWTLGALSVGHVVFDPFMGSGTTAIACIRTGRRFIGCEIEPKYFEIAVKRVKAELAQPRLFKPEPVNMEQAEMFGGGG